MLDYQITLWWAYAGHTLVTHGFAESFILLAALISQRTHPDLCVSAIGKHKVQ